MTFQFVRSSLCLLLLSLVLDAAVAGGVNSVDIAVDDEIEVNLQHYAADGDDALLWLPSESGLLDQDRTAAAALASSGVPVWLADVLSAWFLPALPSSIDALPAEKIAVLVEKLHKQTGKRLFLVGSGRGALLALRVAQAWQLQYGQQTLLGGVIMISPKLFVETPEPGMPGELMPVVTQTNLPIFIVQPSNSPWRWKLDRMVPALEQAGSDVYTRVLPGVRDRFYYRPDAIAAEDRMAERLPTLLQQSVRLLASYNQKPRPLTISQTAATPVSSGKKERLLRAYQGNPEPPALRLPTLDGEIIDLAGLKGQVVLVNFWASWCPPCVHEMPSMQVLADRLASKPFRILAVNMAEDRTTVQDFLQHKVSVRFPILMDADGSALKRWQVFAFPTSYVIGKQGRIRLALFGAIDWMQADVMRQLQTLIDE